MRSFFLGTDFKTKRLSANVNRPGINFLGTKSSSVPADPVTKETKDFLKVTRQVIAYLEGGYYNPVYHNAGPLYAKSGETMFGIDRKTGGPELNTSTEGKAFWAKIEAAQKDEKWRYNYIPPDPLQGELVTLAAKMLEVRYERLMNAYIKDKELKIIRKQQFERIANVNEQRLKVGDSVRILKPNEVFQKIGERYFRQIYTVANVNPFSYDIKNEAGDILQNS